MNINISGGLAGKILRVNLSSGETSVENTERYARRFIGGRAINSFILLNEMNPQTKWSDPENMIIFGAGCLVGTMAPGACRISVDTKNAFNNGKGSANAGGNFGAELKYAGYDHIIITGQAENPVYLWINDDNVELRDASFIWGKTTYETESILREDLGDNNIEVASIGPAGENLVRGSGIVVDCSKVAGGSGVGCVMGIKKLKAVVVRGHGSINVAQPERFFDAATRASKKTMNSEGIKMRQGDLVFGYLPESELWDMSTLIRNGQDEHWPMDKRINLTGINTGVPKYQKKLVACISCPVGGLPFFEIDEGKYKGTRGINFWTNAAMYAEKFDVDDPAAALKFYLSANQLGLDGDFASVVLSWAFECYEKGLLTKQDTDGLALEWGNADAMIEMERKLAYREGIGNLLANGVKEASIVIGRGSEKFALHMKGQDTFDPYRIMKGFGFGVSTSPVAGRHLRGAVIDPSCSGPAGLDFSPTGYENVPEAVFWQIKAEEIENIAGFCVYMGSFGGAHALEPSDYTELINSAMGIDLTEEEVMSIARSSYNLEKAFNTIHTDFDRKDDYPPARYMNEPVKSGPYKGYMCDKEEWDVMLDRFYELHGWDKKTGLQTRNCLIEMDMQDVADKLEKTGKLIP